MKELVELRTAHSKTFDLGNGLRRVVIQQGQHYADRDTGRYEETPSAVTDDTYVPDFDYRFKGQHWSRFGRGKYKVGLARGKSITYTFPDVIPSVDGATVTYENAWQSTDLRLLCFPEGVKEEIVLKDSSAPSSFTFGITAEGVTLSLNGNAIDILDGDKVIGKIPAPLAVDANGSRSEAVLSLIDSGITITLDAGWLATAVYPITLDPTTVTIQPDAATGKDAYVYSYNNTTNYGTADLLRVGRYTSTQIYRAFIEMSVSFIPSGSGIQSAVLSLYCIEEASTDDRDVDVFAVTGAWDEGTVTWDTQPTVSGTSLARTTVTAPNAWFSWSIASIVRDWMLGTATNRGLCFKGNEADYDSANKAFASSDHATASYRPKLEIVYTARPTVSITSPNGTQASPTAVNNMVTPVLNGAYASADGITMAYREHQVFDEVGNTVWDSGKVALNTPIFVRPSPKYDSAGTLIPSGVPSYEDAKFAHGLHSTESTYNLLTENQSSVETDLTGLQEVNCTISRDTTKAWHGSASLKVSVAAGSTSYQAGVAATSRISVTAEQVYTASAYAQASAPKNLQVLFDWYDSDGAQIVATWSDATAVGTAEWTRLSFTQTAPTGAASVIIAFGAQDDQGAFDYWIDGLQLE